MNKFLLGMVCFCVLITIISLKMDKLGFAFLFAILAVINYLGYQMGMKAGVRG